MVGVIRIVFVQPVTRQQVEHYKEFMIYNRNDQPLLISEIMLASGEETGFRINVDGRKGDHFQNVRIQADDSLYVFVEVTVNPNASNQPLLVDDSIIFTTNGVKQSVRLEAYGQNVNLYKNGLILTQDTHFTADGWGYSNSFRPARHTTTG